MRDNVQYVTEEQQLYARYLEKGMYIGLLILLITFVIYATGIIDPYIPMSGLGEYWKMTAHEYLVAAKVPSGWGWVNLLGYGDFINFIGIALLSAITIICYIAIIPTLLRNNDKVYAILAGIEALVLALAASGLLASGGH